MRDPDLELQQLEDEFPASLKALHVKAPKRLMDRVTAVARSSALQLAAGRPVEERPFPRFIPPIMRGRSARPRVSKFAASSKSAPRPRFPRKDEGVGYDDYSVENLDFSFNAADAPGGSVPPLLDEANRLAGRDEETWLQRIAELSLQGNLGEARRLMGLFESEFG